MSSYTASKRCLSGEWVSDVSHTALPVYPGRAFFIPGKKKASAEEIRTGAGFSHKKTFAQRYGMRWWNARALRNMLNLYNFGLLQKTLKL